MEQVFACNDKTMLSTLLFCDSRINCRNGEDETNCSSLTLDSPKTLCNMVKLNNIGLLSDICPKLNQKATFNFIIMAKGVGSEFGCIFERDNVDLAFLKNGSHLLDCHNFTCSTKYYKCPGSYCIPWRFVCNGIWECPGGMEENQCNRTCCPGQYLCLKSVICLSPESICDLVNDCRYGDDEYFCSPHIPKCHPDCQCLLLAIYYLNTIHFSMRI